MVFELVSSAFRFEVPGEEASVTKFLVSLVAISLADRVMRCAK